MTLLRFHLDRADCGSIPKGFHTCPRQFMHIATTVYRAYQSIYLIYLLFFLRMWVSCVWVGRTMALFSLHVSKTLARKVFNHRPCHVLVVSCCTWKLLRRRIFHQDLTKEHVVSTILESLETLNLHQSSTAAVCQTLRLNRLKESERDFVCAKMEPGWDHRWRHEPEPGTLMVSATKHVQSTYKAHIY